MSGSLSYLGRLGITDAFPFLKVLRTNIAGLITLVLPDISARIAGLTKFQLNFKPPTIATNITLALKILAAARIAITPPSVSLQASFGVLAQLNLIKAALQAALGWGTFPGEVHLFVYEGRAADMGSTIQMALSGGNLGTISGTSLVLAPFVVVEVADAVAVGTVRELFKMPSARVRIQ